MPARWLIFAFILFAVAMFAVKFSLSAAIGTWGYWVIIPFAVVVMTITLLVDRHDKKGRERLND
jgi:4-hydroxybenzoate polyprenyltransferase